MFQKVTEPWSRQEHFDHYLNHVRCSYSFTVEIEVTELHAKLKALGLKTYPVHIYLLAAAVNQLPEFRMGLVDGAPGYWEVVHPAYTIFHPETKTFSSIWTPFEQNFRKFYQACTEDLANYQADRKLFPQKKQPANLFDLSSIPWLAFTAFDLQIAGTQPHLAPIFTIGKYRQQQGKIFMPLAVQLHHAACDGYHAGQFVEAVRLLAKDCQWLEE